MRETLTLNCPSCRAEVVTDPELFEARVVNQIWQCGFCGHSWWALAVPAPTYRPIGQPILYQYDHDSAESVVPYLGEH